MKRIIYLFFVIIIFSDSNSYSQKRFTLSEALQTGIQNSKNLKISNSKIVSSEASIDAANSQLLPQLKFSANYTRLSDVPSFIVDLPILQKPFVLAQTILNNYTFKLSLQQPLFTGFRLTSQKHSSQYIKEATEIDYQKDKNDEALNIQTAFWNLYKALEIKNVIDDNYKMVEKHLTDTKNLYDNGLATQNDVLKLEVQLSNTKLLQLDANNNIELGRTVFNKAMGLPLNENTGINPEEIQVKDNFDNYQDLLNEAINNRDEIKSTEKRIEANKELIKAGNSGYFPQVFVNGDYYMSRPNQRYQPPVDVFHGTWDLGITLSWDIWTWGNTSSQVIQSEQNLIQTQTLKEQLKENIELEVNQNYLALKYAKEKLDVLTITIDQTEENLKITYDKYHNQLATSTDLIDAENSVISSETNYKTALVDYELAKVKLEKAIGRKIY